MSWKGGVMSKLYGGVAQLWLYVSDSSATNALHQPYGTSEILIPKLHSTVRALLA